MAGVNWSFPRNGLGRSGSTRNERASRSTSRKSPAYLGFTAVRSHKGTDQRLQTVKEPAGRRLCSRPVRRPNATNIIADGREGGLGCWTGSG